MTWKKELIAPKPPLHNGIKCLDCNVLLARKSQCRDHKGHEVVYLDEKGEVAK